MKKFFIILATIVVVLMAFYGIWTLAIMNSIMQCGIAVLIGIVLIGLCFWGYNRFHNGLSVVIIVLLMLLYFLAVVFSFVDFSLNLTLPGAENVYFEEVENQYNENVDTQNNENVDTQNNENVDTQNNENVSTQNNENVSTQNNENVDTQNNENVDIQNNENVDTQNNENVSTQKNVSVYNSSNQIEESTADYDTETSDTDELEVAKATASVNWGDHVDGATVMMATVTVSGDSSVNITSNFGVNVRQLSTSTYYVEVTLPEGSGVAAIEVSGDNLDSVESSKSF